jgi:hypothetical protein
VFLTAFISSSKTLCENISDVPFRVVLEPSAFDPPQASVRHKSVILLKGTENLNPLLSGL